VHLHPWFLGTGTAIGPRGRDDAIARVVSTEHGNLATKCASREYELPVVLFVINRRMRSLGVRLASDRSMFSAQLFRADVNQSYVLEPSRYTPTFDFLVESPEEFERDTRDLELADYVPCEERVKDLFRDVERRKVLHLESEP